MIFDYNNKEIQIKIVYYGPAMSGKTTSIRALFSYFGKKNELKSIESSVGRTLFFDFGVLELKGTIWTLKFLLYSATGQDFYISTRPAVINGVDGIIFVLDAQHNYIEHNLKSWNELINYFGEKVYEIPIVIALNKYDLENVDKLNENDLINYIDFKKFKCISLYKTSASSGTGVLDSFKQIVKFIFPELKISG